MANAKPFALFIDAGVYPVLAKLPPGRRRRLMEDLHRIARYPALSVDYSDTDPDGNPHHHVLTGEFLVSYYVDHAVRRVLITEIDRP